MTVYRSGYGQGAYGANNYGLDGSIIDAAAVIATVSTASAEVGKIMHAAGVFSASSSTGCAAEIVRQCVAATGCAASGSSACNRVQFSGTAGAAILSGSINAIKKWEPEAETAETWSDVAASSKIWQDAASTPETWVDASP